MFCCILNEVSSLELINLDEEVEKASWTLSRLYFEERKNWCLRFVREALSEFIFQLIENIFEMETYHLYILIGRIKFLSDLML